MTGARLSKNVVRVIGSKFISKICLRTFRRGVRIKGGDLLKIISFFVINHLYFLFIDIYNI